MVRERVLLYIGCMVRQYLPETTVGLIMKLASPLLKRMFNSSPEDLSITVEQGVLEYPTHAYHVREGALAVMCALSSWLMPLATLLQCLLQCPPL